MSSPFAWRSIVRRNLEFVTTRLAPRVQVPTQPLRKGGAGVGAYRHLLWRVDETGLIINTGSRPGARLGTEPGHLMETYQCFEEGTPAAPSAVGDALFFGYIFGTL